MNEIERAIGKLSFIKSSLSYCNFTEWKSYFDDESLEESLEVAIQALQEKQERENEMYPFGRCKSCGYEFNSELINEYNIKYCPECGKKIGCAE